jgi:hypothetical protein
VANTGPIVAHISLEPYADGFVITDADDAVFASKNDGHVHDILMTLQFRYEL